MDETQSALTHMDREQTAQMAAWIAERHEVMAEILKRAVAQEKAVQEGLVEPLVSCLNEKQQWVDRLATLQRQLAPYAECAPANREWSSEEARERCARLIEETARMQAAILDIDGRCEQRMVERRDEIAAELQNAQGLAHAARAYTHMTNLQSPLSGSSVGGAAGVSGRGRGTSGGRGGALDVTSH